MGPASLAKRISSLMALKRGAAIHLGQGLSLCHGSVATTGRYPSCAADRSQMSQGLMVFDLGRVPPDPKRLEGVYRLGHTTWSHARYASQSLRVGLATSGR